MNQKRIDDALYDALRPRLIAAMETMVAAGRSAREWTEFWMERLTEAETPYLGRFLEEIRDGTVKITGLGESARKTLFGARITPEQRDAMIREAAYFRAQARGFEGGSPEQDWAEAEAQVDRMLAEDAGLIGKGQQALSTLSDLVHRELEEVRELVSTWITHRHRPQH